MSAVETRLPPGISTVAIVGAALAGLFGGTHELVSISMPQGPEVAGMHTAVQTTGGSALEVWAEPQPAQSPLDGAHTLVLNALADGAGEFVYAAGAQRGSHYYGTGVHADGGTDYYDAVLIAYGQDGEARWVRTAGDASEGSSFRSVSTGGDGTVYAAGWSRGIGPIDLGPGVTLERTTSGTTAILVAYDSDGGVRWAASPRWEQWDPWGWSLQRIPGHRSGAGPAPRSAFESVAVDRAGDVYAAGAQRGTDLYHYGENVSARATARGSNALLVKYDASGNAQWARTIGSGAGGSEFLSVAVDNGGSVYVAGYQDGTEALGYGSGVIARGDSVRTNAVLAKYAPDGTTEWVRTATGSAGASRFMSVAVDSDGNVYVAGSQRGSESFTYGRMRIAGPSSGENPVLVSFASDGSDRWARTTAADAVSAFFRSVTVGENGMVYVAGSQFGTEELDYGNGVLVTGATRLGNPVLVRYTRDGIARWAATGKADQHGPAFDAVAANGQEGVLTLAAQPHVVYDYTFPQSGADPNGEIRTFRSKVLRIVEESGDS